MKIEKFNIQNYRAIENIDLNLSFSINPIIGVNESGKTTVLKAILAFDKDRDRINRGEHLIFQNKYSTRDTIDCKISATIKLDKKELENLIKKLKLNTESKEFEVISKFKTTERFVLTRELSLPNPIYSYNHELLDESTNNKITSFLVSTIPFILYFDDFSDRVPDKIPFHPEYVKTGKLKRVKYREWQEIIEEIFKRANTEGINDDENPLQTYMKIDNSDRKGDILADIEAELNKEIITEWKKIKKRGNSLADDTDKLELVIVNENSYFAFKVRDKSNNDRQRTFDISERSKGFQWYFNYMIKLKFNPNYKKKLENSIFLLDEPGSYLHSSAQVELLNELKRVSAKNTIIYCTHSQYLLNPAVIKLGSIKIAGKSKSKINLQEYGTYKGKKDKSALSPIYQALQLNVAHDFVGKIVITEGITDYYLFKIIQAHSKHIANNVTFIPSSGASQSSTLISLAIPFSDDFSIFLDNDKAGKQAKRKYIREFGLSVESKIHIYRASEPEFLLEDFLSDNDKDKLLSITASTELKRAFGFLFYDYKDRQKDFIKGLDKDTLTNLDESFEAIKRIKT